MPASFEEDIKTGKNEFVLYQSPWVKSQSFGWKFVQEKEPQTKRQTGNIHALLVGLNEINQQIGESFSLPVLQGAVNDVVAFSNMFDNWPKHNDDIGNTINNLILTNRDATYNAIINQLKDVSLNASDGDFIFVLLSGHGNRDGQGRSYFMPWDTDFTKGRDYPESVIRGEDIYKITNDYPKINYIFFLETQGDLLKEVKPNIVAIANSEQSREISINNRYQGSLAFPFIQLIQEGNNPVYEEIGTKITDPQLSGARVTDAKSAPIENNNNQSIVTIYASKINTGKRFLIDQLENIVEAVPITLPNLFQQINPQQPIPLADLNQPQYLLAAQQIQQKLTQLGLLDPVIEGSVDNPFGPVEVFNGQVHKNAEAALISLCRRLRLTYAQEGRFVLTREMIEALLNPDTAAHFPLQLEANQDDDQQTAFAKRILRHMQQKGYWINRCSDSWNIVYVEGVNGDGTLNSDAIDEWNDRRLLIRINPQGAPEIGHNSAATIEPGTYYINNPLDPDGAAFIGFGQYKAWQMGQHQGSERALVQRGNILIHRDKNKSGKRNAETTEVGTAFGINQHGTSPGRLPDKVGRYGASSLVGQDYQKHQEFMDLLEKDIRSEHNQQYMFMTTILDGSQINIAPVSKHFYPDIKIIQQMITRDKLHMTTVSWHELLVKISKAVGRVKTRDGSRVITGFLLEGGYLLTVNHELPDADALMSAELEMNYEMDTEGKIKSVVKYSLDASDFISSPVKELDFTYVKVKDDPANPLSQWGYLELSLEKEVKAKDSLVLISHPRGEDKKVSFEPEGVIEIDSSKGQIRYINDTESGSSGAPILNSLLQVVGLHIGRNVKDANYNYGINIIQIMKDIEQKKKPLE